MTKKEESLQQIGAAVRSQVEQQGHEMIARADECRRKELEDYANTLTENMCRKMQKTVSQMRQRARSNVAKAEQEAYAGLLRRRMELAEKLFENALERLEQFASTAEYQQWMQEQIVRYKNLCDHRDSRLRVCGRDEALALQLVKCLPGCSVQVDESVHPGGFVLFNGNQGLCVDETLAGCLADQKSWFLVHCGLKVQQEGEAGL